MNYMFGPLPGDAGTLFRLWAPSQEEVRLLLENRDAIAMQKNTVGFWQAHVDNVSSGARYRFGIDGYEFPDPASREQETDADGWSIVRGASGRPPHPRPLRPWHQTILCEVHVGTVSPEGTFKGLMDRLEHFRDAGYTGLEIMPVNEFPGQRGWGYDGTLIFAPDKSYGTPEDLRALVDRAHDIGLCIILDVVYNHFGETYNFIPRYAPEWFDRAAGTPWGPAIDVRQAAVRQFYYENACWWLQEYDVDGLRFDAVHEITTEARGHFLSGLAHAARSIKPDANLIIENINNQMHWLLRDLDDKPVDYTAQWNDDFHHVLQFLLTGEERDGYEDDSRDPVADFEKALADGFVHDGDAEGESDGRTRNEPASLLPMQAFISYLHNHDQIGNRPDGRRIVERVDADRLDFAHFVILLSPQIPLFFMGEEAHLRTPFMYFCDLPEPVGSQRRDDRYDQMEHMFNTKVDVGSLPDPQDPGTFERSHIDWDAYGREEHRNALERFRQLTALRRELIWPLAATRCLSARSARQGDAVIVTWQYEAGTYNMVLNPTSREATVELSLTGPAASTGRFEVRDGHIKISPWSALVWKS